MKPTSKTKKQPVQPQHPPTVAAGIAPLHWAFLGLGLVIVAGLTWGFMEFVIWNKLPRELVGTWEVVQGPPEFRAVCNWFAYGYNDIKP